MNIITTSSNADLFQVSSLASGSGWDPPDWDLPLDLEHQKIEWLDADISLSFHSRKMNFVNPGATGCSFKFPPPRGTSRWYSDFRLERRYSTFDL
jgi:hypothetical protein